MSLKNAGMIMKNEKYKKCAIRNISIISITTIIGVYICNMIDYYVNEDTLNAIGMALVCIFWAIFLLIFINVFKD